MKSTVYERHPSLFLGCLAIFLCLACTESKNTYTFEAEFPDSDINLTHFKIVTLSGASSNGAIEFPHEITIPFNRSHPSILYNIPIEEDTNELYSLYARVSVSKRTKSAGIELLIEHNHISFTFSGAVGRFSWEKIAEIRVDSLFTLRVFPSLPFTIIDRFALTKTKDFDPTALDKSEEIDENVPSECYATSKIVSFEGMNTNENLWALSSTTSFYSEFYNQSYEKYELVPEEALKGFLVFSSSNSRASSPFFSLGRNMYILRLKLFWLSTTGKILIYLNHCELAGAFPDDEQIEISIESFLDFSGDLSDSIDISISAVDLNGDVIVYGLIFLPNPLLCGDGKITCLEQCDQGSTIDDQSFCDAHLCVCSGLSLPDDNDCSLPKCTGSGCANCIDDDLCSECFEGYAGVSCKECSEGWFGYPDCQPVLCESPFCGECGNDNICMFCTDENIVGESCDRCKYVGPDYASFPDCNHCRYTQRSFPSCQEEADSTKFVLNSIFIASFVVSVIFIVYLLKTNWVL